MKKQKKLNKKIIIIFSVILLTVVIAFAIFRIMVGNDDSYNYYENSYSETKYIKGQKYYLKSYSDSTYGYACSKQIEFVYGDQGLTPTNQGEFNKYCRTTGAIEYRAVIDILQREDVSKTIGNYNTAEAWVRALGHKYIHDKDYLNRILPAYSDMKIDCIIVVHSPEGTRFFIENGEVHKNHDDHQYIEVSSTEFLGSLNNASDSDVNNFWLALH